MYYSYVEIEYVATSFSPARMDLAVKLLTAIRFWREQKLPPHRIPTVGIVKKVPSTTNTTIHKDYHHGGAVCPSYDMGSMDPPDLTLVTSLERVGQEHFAWVNC
jgi:hypothetical protein